MEQNSWVGESGKPSKSNIIFPVEYLQEESTKGKSHSKVRESNGGKYGNNKKADD